MNNALNFAQMMAESRKRKVQTEKTVLPPPPKVLGLPFIVRLFTSIRSIFYCPNQQIYLCLLQNGKNKKVPEESA